MGEVLKCTVCNFGGGDIGYGCWQTHRSAEREIGDDVILLFDPDLFPPPTRLGGGRGKGGQTRPTYPASVAPIENALYYSQAYEKLCRR